MNASPNTGPAIEAKNLTKNFGSLVAVDDLSLQVQKGEIFGIVGPDGAGKTTTLRMLSGIMDPASGSASIAGFDTQTQAFDVKENLAYMSQRFGLYPDLSVMENIQFYADLYGVPRKGRDERINELLGFSQMRPFKKRKAGALSGGMKQKLQLVCALIHTPAVLLLDEPTNGVDPVSRREFWRLLRGLGKRGITLVMSTPYMDEAERADRVAVLHEGRLVLAGPPGEIRSNWDRRILEFFCEGTREAAKLLSGRYPGGEAQAFGDRVHLVVPRDGPRPEDVAGILAEGGVEVKRFGAARPGLENVFLSRITEESSHA